jgi:hypothetical protein
VLVPPVSRKDWPFSIDLGAVAGGGGAETATGDDDANSYCEPRKDWSVVGPLEEERGVGDGVPWMMWCCWWCCWCWWWG